MKKSGLILLVIVAVAALAIGFVIGQVVQSTVSTGTKDDPLVSKSYVDKLIGERLSSMQTQIEELQADVTELQTLAGVQDTDNSSDTNSNDTNNNNSNENDNSNNSVETPTKVKVTSNGVNIRKSASTDAEKVGTATAGDILTYLDKKEDSAGKVWYKVELSNGTQGWVAGWLCGTPY